MKCSSPSPASFIFRFFMVCLLFDRIQPTTASLRVPFLPSNRKKYTPLVFFTLPKGRSAECDAMEKIVSQVERELGVRVERLDCARDPAAPATLAVMTQRRPAPFLYHRESCQIVYVPGVEDSERKGVADAAAASSPSATPVIDKRRVRAWAKGRFLPPPGVNLDQRSSSSTRAPIVIGKDDNALDQNELIKDATLTPMQLKGKEAMRARTAERMKKSSR
jgi:hypothetical protein